MPKHGDFSSAVISKSKSYSIFVATQQLLDI